MTDQTPIASAAEAMRRDNCPCEHLCYCSDWHREAQLAFESIDEEDLAQALIKHQLGNPTGGTTGTARVTCSCGHVTKVANGVRDVAQKRAAQHQALAVKHWLT